MSETQSVTQDDLGWIERPGSYFVSVADPTLPGLLRRQAKKVGSAVSIRKAVRGGLLITVTPLEGER